MKISIYNDWDHIPKAEKEGLSQVILPWDGEYRKGDIIEFSGLTAGKFYVVQADAALKAESVPEGYTATYDNATGTITTADAVCTVTNTKQGAVPTSTIPIGASGAVVAGVAITVAAKRRKRKES